MRTIRMMFGLDWGLPAAERKKILVISLTTISTTAALLKLADPFGWLGSAIPESNHDAWTIGILGLVSLLVVMAAYSRAAYIIAEQERTTREQFRSTVHVSDYTVADSHILRLLQEAATPLKVDALGAGLGRFWQLAHSQIRTVPQGSTVRVLLLDPSFPDPREGKNLASVRERSSRTPDRQIRRDILHWRKWLQENPILNSILEVRLYRATPTMAMVRIGKDLTFTPYLLPTGRQRTPVLRIPDAKESEKTTYNLYESLVDNFKTLWGSNNTRGLLEVPAWELDAWESNILLPVSR